MAGNNQAPSPAAMYAAFRKSTQQNQYLQPAMVFSQFGQQVTLQLPQTGYLGRIYLKIAGTITTGAGTPAGSWASYPPLPWALIKRIRLYSSQGVEIINCSGWGMYLATMRKQNVSLFAGDVIQFINSTNRAAGYTTQTGTPAQNNAYTFNGLLELPVMTDDSMMHGLINTQTNDVRLYLEITMCNQSDTGTISGVTLTPAFNITPQIEFYLVPADAAAQPNLSFIHSWYEEFFPFTTVGDIVYRPTPGNSFVSLSGIAENNGAQIANTNINTVKLVYAQGVAPFYEDYTTACGRFKRLVGQMPPDGYFTYTFDAGSGNTTELDPRDFLNSANQTDLQFIPNITGITPSSAQLRCVREQLSRVG